jgi:hypothetical protein
MGPADEDRVCALSSATKTDRRSLTFYYEEEPGRQSAANLMTKDEARARFSKLDCASSPWLRSASLRHIQFGSHRMGISPAGPGKEARRS